MEAPVLPTVCCVVTLLHTRSYPTHFSQHQRQQQHLTLGGIFVPIIKFLSKSVGDDPEKGTRKKMGAFLMQSQLQQSSYSSALFLTSGAQNLLCLNLAAELGE